MAKQQEWRIIVENQEYQVRFKPSAWSGKLKVEVNGEPTVLKNKAFQAFTGVDQPIMLGNKEVRFVLIGGKADLAVDGFYVDSKKQYVPLKDMPRWAWIFVVLCIAIPIVSLGGAIPFLIGLGGSVLNVKISVSSTMSKSAKLLSCIGVTVGAWIILTLLFISASMI